MKRRKTARGRNRDPLAILKSSLARCIGRADRMQIKWRTRSRCQGASPCLVSRHDDTVLVVGEDKWKREGLGGED